MANSEQLERQAEHTRKQLAATLDELRGRLTPAGLGREALNAARRSTAARFATNLGVDARTNAVPLASLAASIAWVMLSKGRRPGAAPSAGSYDRVRGAVGQVLDATERVASKAVQTATAAGSAAQGAARSLSQTASGTAERITEATSGTVTSTRSAGQQMQERLKNAARSTRRASRSVVAGVSSARKQATLTAGTAYRLARNDPVFTAGIGLALVGVAATAFGWSRNPVDGRAAGDSADAARGKREAKLERKVSPIPATEAPIIQGAAPASKVYGEDLTGTERLIDDPIAQ